MSDEEHGLPETSHSNYLLSIIGAIGSLLLFALIIFIAYLPNRPGPVNARQVEQRLTNLAEVEAKQTDLASNYTWVNEKEGRVRIPVERAMQLAAARLAKGKPAFALPAGEPAPADSAEASGSADDSTASVEKSDDSANAEQ